MSGSQPRGDCGGGFGRRDHRNDLELDQVLPAGHPLREELLVLTLHNLEAAPKVVGDLARDVPKALGRQAALVAKSTVHRQRLPLAKMLDDHVKHAASVRAVRSGARSSEP